MLCGKCRGTYEGYDSCPACAERDEKRAESIRANVWRIMALTVIAAAMSVLTGCGALLGLR